MSVPLYQSGGSGSSLATPVSLANGGTHADLSATGGANQVLKQSSSGADVTVAALVAADLPVLNSADMGYLWSNGQMSTIVGQSGTQVFVSVANETWAVQFILPVGLTLGKVTFKSGATVVAATSASFGIYDSAGNLKCQGTFSTAASASTVQTATFTRVTLPPGVYYFAWTANNATTNAAETFAVGNTLATDLNFAATAKRVGKGTASSGGVLNASLGTITGALAPNQAMPACLFEYN